MTFVPFQTLTAAELNALLPPDAPLLGGSSGSFTIRTAGDGLAFSGSALVANYRAAVLTSFGTGLSLSGGVLTPNWQGPTITALGSGVSAAGGTLTATGSGGSVTDVETGALLTGGPITGTGTISVAAIAPMSLIANAGSISAVPAAVPVGNGLSFNSGTLEATGATSNVWFYKADTAITSGTPPIGSLYWNNATQTSATLIALSHITTDGIDVDLFIDQIQPGNTLVLQLANSSPDFQTWVCSGPITVHANSYVEVPVTLVSSGGVGTTGFANNAKLFVALLSTSAAGAAGGVLSGTYPNPGFANIAAQRILANSGTVSGPPAATPVGPGITLNNGTLQVAQVAATTLVGTAGGTLTLSPNVFQDVIVQMPNTGGTVTLNVGTVQPRQRVFLDIVNGATLGTLTLHTGVPGSSAGFIFGSSVTSYTPGGTNSTDNIICIAPTTTILRVEAIDLGFAV